MKGSTERLNDAFCLAAVCRVWRKVAHSSSQFWCTFKTTPSKGSEAFLTQVVQLIGSRPADISIEDIRKEDVQRLRTWQLSRIINLARLTLDFHSHSNVKAFPQGLFTETYHPLKELDIKMDTSFGTKISYRVICAQFPSLVTLRIGNVKFDHLPSVEMLSLKVLVLEDSSKVDIAHLAKTFPRLETMDLRLVSLEDINSPPIVTLCNVHKLTLIETPLLQEPWAERVKFPCLEWLLYDASITSSARDFIKSLPNVRKLDCITDDDLVIEFATCLPKLQELTITSSLDILVNWKSYGLQHPPFPSLRKLGYAEPSLPMNESVFEAIIRARCLPQGHPESLLEDPSLVISEFIVALENPEWESEPWTSHPLAQEAIKEIAPYEVIPDLCCLVMKWSSL